MTGEQDRERILAALWSDIRSVNAENARQFPAAQRAIDGGAHPEDVATAMAAAAYEATFRTLYILTGEEDLQDLVSSNAAAMLHEDLLTADPTGREGTDLFE